MEFHKSPHKFAIIIARIISPKVRRFESQLIEMHISALRTSCKISLKEVLRQDLLVLKKRHRNSWLSFTMSEGLVDTLHTHSIAAVINSVLIDEANDLFQV